MCYFFLDKHGKKIVHSKWAKTLDQGGKTSCNQIVEGGNASEGYQGPPACTLRHIIAVNRQTPAVIRRTPAIMPCVIPKSPWLNPCPEAGRGGEAELQLYEILQYKSTFSLNVLSCLNKGLKVL